MVMGMVGLCSIALFLVIGTARFLCIVLVGTNNRISLYFSGNTYC